MRERDGERKLYSDFSGLVMIKQERQLYGLIGTPTLWIDKSAIFRLLHSELMVK